MDSEEVAQELLGWEPPFAIPSRALGRGRVKGGSSRESFKG